MSATQFFQKQYSKLPNKWHLILIRVTIYSCMVGWGSFETGVEGFDSIGDLSKMQVIKLCGNIFMAMSGVWLAFIDQTLSNSHKQLPETTQQQQPTGMEQLQQGVIPTTQKAQ